MGKHTLVTFMVVVLCSKTRKLYYLVSLYKLYSCMVPRKFCLTVIKNSALLVYKWSDLQLHRVYKIEFG